MKRRNKTSRPVSSLKLSRRTIMVVAGFFILIVGGMIIGKDGVKAQVNPPSIPSTGQRGGLGGAGYATTGYVDQQITNLTNSFTTQINNLNSQITTINNQIASGGAGGGGIGVYKYDGTTYLGKFMSYDQASSPSTCTAWTYLPTGGSPYRLSSWDCQYVNQGPIYYNDSGCTTLIGTPYYAQMWRDDRHTTYNWSGYANCPGNNYSIWDYWSQTNLCHAHIRQNGQCVPQDVAVYWSHRDGRSQSYVYPAGFTSTPLCGGAPCVLK